MSNAEKPKPGDFIEVGPGSTGYDLKSLRGMGRIEIKETKDCSLKLSCHSPSDNCMLITLELPRRAELHGCKICYEPTRMKLHKTTDSMKDANALIMNDNEKSYKSVVYNGKVHRVYKSNKTKEVDTSEIEDLIF